jgi:proteasome lid subunit RPN8/RPN11
MLTYSEILSSKELLRGCWDPVVERCGTITNLEVIEVLNRAQDPKNTFAFQIEDLENGAQATWHSHPVTSANLSIDDHRFFQSWPEMIHFVIGVDEIRCYQVQDGIVYNVEDEEDYSPREAQGAL